jgi:hypothetical protein
VTSKAPNATVQTDKRRFGRVRTVSYSSVRAFLRDHPRVVRRYDAVEGSGYYTYWDKKRKTYRQVYFEDERSLAAKYDYVIANGLAGVGIWTLDNDRGRSELWNALRVAFEDATHRVGVTASVVSVRRVSGSVHVRLRATGRDTGTAPERGSFRWTIRTAAGRLIRSGAWPAQMIYPGRTATRVGTFRLAQAARLPAGQYTLRVRFVTAARMWRAPDVVFRQPY